ncbi:MAG TPA: hypothetical protein VER03_00110 [Bryobacteraceae bacterium]|nr:hypothetical protein [Bryobacteraceae bacterium]
MNHPRTGGPKTDAGKAKCAQNAIKHGATSTKLFVLANERPEAWAALLDATLRDYAPTTETEYAYVEAIAFAIWRLRRIWAVQTCAINLEMDNQAETYSVTYGAGADENVRRTLAIQALTADEQALARLIRYETTLQRAHDRAVRNLRNLRDMRAAAAPSAETQHLTAPIAEPANLKTAKQTSDPAGAVAPAAQSTSTPQPALAQAPAPSRAQSPDVGAPIPPTKPATQPHLPENTSLWIWRPSCPKSGIRVEPSSCPDAK